MPCACIDLYDWSLKFHKTWLSGLVYGWLQAWPALPRKSFVRGGEYLWQRRTPRKRDKLFWFTRKYEEKRRCQTPEKSQVSTALFLTTDPRWPRGSRSGRKERSDESFQAQAEKPLGNDSHKTISEQSSEFWLLIGHKNFLVLLCPIGEQCLLSSVRVFVSEGYCLAILVRFVHQSPRDLVHRIGKLFPVKGLFYPCNELLLWWFGCKQELIREERVRQFCLSFFWCFYFF